MQAQEIAAGLEYLHKNEIVHGDLKIVSIKFDHFLNCLNYVLEQRHDIR